MIYDSIDGTEIQTAFLINHVCKDIKTTAYDIKFFDEIILNIVNKNEILL